MRTRPYLAAFLALATSSYTACPQSSAVIAAYGFTELRPPSTLLNVGTLVTVVSHDPFEARVICSAESSLGPHMRVMRSRTANSRLRHLDNKRFNLDVSALIGGRSSEQYQAVQSVHATLKNARIIELSDDDVLLGMRDRTPACEWAVRERVRQGYVVTMISSVLIGDLSVDVSFAERHGHHADLADKALVMADLAVALDGEVTSTLGTNVESTGLIFGIKDEEFFAALSATFIDESLFSRDSRHLPASIEHAGEGVVMSPAQ